MAQRSVPAPFLTKTYQLVDDPSSDAVISWNENGSTFVVWNTVDFARDMLPKSFKHNNFSSFVRQLNTYGFRKTVPDKWEFANDNFRRGQIALLSQIRRRKAVPSPPAQANAGDKSGGQSTQSNSGEDIASTSTSDSKNPGSVETAATVTQAANLSDENEKLKRENENLNSELAEAKKQCDQLVKFLMEGMKVGPDKINQIVRQGTCGSTCDVDDCDLDGPDDDDDDENRNDGMKLFGVWVKGDHEKTEKKKRVARDEILAIGGGGPMMKKMKNVMFNAPMLMSGSCN